MEKFEVILFHVWCLRSYFEKWSVSQNSKKKFDVEAELSIDVRLVMCALRYFMKVLGCSIKNGIIYPELERRTWI